MKKINNILKYKALSQLPRGGGFYSGDCPGAAAITIKLSLFSSLRDTLGGKREAGSRKSEACKTRSKNKLLVSDSLFLIYYFLFPSFGNKEHRIRNVKSGRNIPALLSVFRAGLFCGLAANPDGARSSVRVGTPEKPEMASIEGRNIQYPIFNTQYSTMNQQPLAETRSMRPNFQEPQGGGELSEGLLTEKVVGRINPAKRGNPEPSGTKYKVAPQLPRGDFYSGVYPGAAAITIILTIFSSPRVSPNWVAEFSTPHSSQCGVTNSTSRSAPQGLPVINMQTLHQGSFVPLTRGTRPRVLGDRGSMKLPKVPERMVLKQKGGTPMS